METLFQKKEQQLKQLNNLKNRILNGIYSGFINKKSVKEIHRDILKISKVYGKNEKFINYSFNLVKQIKKKIELDIDIPYFKMSDSQIADKVLDVYTKKESYQTMKSIAYKEVRKMESENKKYIVEKTLEDNRKLEIPKIFYLTSSHNDSADDHKDWQGKIYVDEKWTTIYNTQEVREYIRKNNIKTFQWVISNPVWFTTRPNCRHYFKSLKTEEVLGKDVKTLIKNHKMHHQIGKKETQNIKHSNRKDWYTKDNVQGIINKYKERLEYHQMLYKTHKSPILRNAIEKDKFLIKKWQNYLQKNFN